MSKTYTTSTDITTYEIVPALETDSDIAAMEYAEIRKLADAAFAEFDRRGLIVYEDGYDERDNVTYLDREGFRLNLNDDLEGSDFWDVIADILDAEAK